MSCGALSFNTYNEYTPIDLFDLPLLIIIDRSALSKILSRLFKGGSTKKDCFKAHAYRSTATTPSRSVSTRTFLEVFRDFGFAQYRLM